MKDVTNSLKTVLKKTKTHLHGVRLGVIEEANSSNLSIGNTTEMTMENKS